MSTRIQQAVSGIKTVRLDGAEDYETTRIDDASRAAYESYLQRNRIRNRYSFMQDAAISVSKASVLAVGGLKALEHQLTPGDVVMFLAYLDRLYGPIEGLMGMYTDMQQHISGVRRAQRLLQEVPTTGTDLPPLRAATGAVSFNDVSFGYTPGTTVLDGIISAAGRRIDRAGRPVRCRQDHHRGLAPWPVSSSTGSHHRRRSSSGSRVTVVGSGRDAWGGG